MYQASEHIPVMCRSFIALIGQHAVHFSQWGALECQWQSHPRATWGDVPSKVDRSEVARCRLLLWFRGFRWLKAVGPLHNCTVAPLIFYYCSQQFTLNLYEASGHSAKGRSRPTKMNQNPTIQHWPLGLLRCLRQWINLTWFYCN